MASYTSHCKHCDTYIDYYRPIADRGDTPVCCGEKSERTLASPMIPRMGLADHYQIVTSSGHVCYGSGDYKKYCEKNGVVPLSDIKGEAEYQKAEGEKKRRRELRSEIEAIARNY